jgi:hypothetical protein
MPNRAGFGLVSCAKIVRDMRYITHYGTDGLKRVRENDGFNAFDLDYLDYH